MSRHPRPPRLARLLVSLLIGAHAREVVTGDLHEEFTRAIGRGVHPGAARRRYWRQALASVAACGRWRRIRLTSPRGVRTADRRHALGRGWAGDLRHAARVLSRSPAFTLVAVLSLGIGIGANTAVYNVIRAVLFAPLAVERPDELALVYWAVPPKSGVSINQINSSQWQDPATGRYYSSNLTYSFFSALSDAAPPDAEMFGFNLVGQATVSIDGRSPLVVGGLLASGRFFATMRVGMALGRPFDQQDDRPGAPAVAVVSHGFWTRALGGDPRVLGKVVRVNGALCEIVGVTARGYRGLSPGGFFPDVDITLPLAAQPMVMARWNASPAAGASMFTSNLFWVRVVARLPSQSPEIERRFAGVLRGGFARLPGGENADLSRLDVRLLPGGRGLDVIRADADGPLQLLAGVSGIVLIMACLNLSALLLARGVARLPELALRRALGAGRAQLMRVLLAESLVLAALGGVCGVLMAVWAEPLAAALLSTGLGVTGVDLGVDWALLGIAASVAVAAAILSGALPALRLSRAETSSSLGQRGETAGARAASGRTLIALQIAVSVPLLVAAGLLLRTIHNLGSVDLGFEPDGLVVFRIEPRLAGTAAERNPSELYERILQRVSTLPGVASAALVENALVSGRTSNTEVHLDGVRIRMPMNAVGPGFFATMRLPILAGRPIGPEDRAGAPPAAVINEPAAAAFFPGTSPIGRRLTVGRREVEIVGVAGPALYRNLRTPPEPMFYDSYLQRSFENIPGLAALLPSAVPSPMHVIVRTGGPGAATIEALPAAIGEAAPELPVPDITTHAAQIEDTIGRERMFGRLLAIFGAFAVLLASIGLHGVTAYSVARRTSEIGIRVALGARRQQVVWLVLRQVLLVAAGGLALGVPIALAVSPALAGLLFGIAPRDGATIAVAAAGMLAVALAAGGLPAARAARLPVIAALRRE